MTSSTSTLAKQYSIKEEILSSTIHSLGIVLGIVALTLLACLSCFYKDAWAIVSCCIFSVSIIFLYTASTLYHAITNENAKKILKKLDHIAIYYLIAGTFTPYILVSIRSPQSWTLLIVIWFCAIFGTFLKILKGANGTKIWSILLYLGMGWSSVFMVKDLVKTVPTTGLVFLILGGFFYTFGIIFYINKGKMFSHAIWHMFVLLGTLMHFFSILFSCAI